MSHREAVELVRGSGIRTAVPVHYEGWTHVRQGRAAVEEELRAAPADVRQRFRWLPPGEPVDLATG